MYNVSLILNAMQAYVAQSRWLSAQGKEVPSFIDLTTNISNYLASVNLQPSPDVVAIVKTDHLTGG